MRRATIGLLCLALACTQAADPPGPMPTRARRGPPARLTFAVKGDFGIGTNVQAAVTARMCDLRTTVPFRYVVTTGDNFYDPDGTATRRTFGDPERCLVRFRGHQWRATWGNHDVRGSSTADILGATDRYYAWSDGGVDFFMLDANDPSDPQQRHWLEQHLKSSRARITVVVFHQPAFSAGRFRGSTPAVQRHWVPLFERYDVTLVLNGHQHTYEHHRSHGVDYVVSGGGGAPLYGCDLEVVTLVTCRAAYHFLLITARGSKLTVEAIEPDGARLDRFTIRA